MTEKLLKLSNILILLMTGSVAVSSLLFPVFSHPGLGILYNSLITAAGFLYVLSRKLLKEENKIETPIDGFIFVMFLLYIISTLFAVNFIVSFNAAVTFFVLLLFYYITYDFSKKYHREFIILIISCVVLLSVYAVYQYFFGFEETLRHVELSGTVNAEAVKSRLESRRVFSTLIYPNTLGGFLILVIPVILGFMKNEKKLRWLSAPALLLALTALLLTRSYGSFISIILAFGLMSLMITHPSVKNFRVIYLLSLLGITVLFALAIKLRGTADLLSGISGRVESYIKMFSVAGSFLINGAGPGSFELVYNRPGGHSAPYLKYAHNVVFQTAIELGIPALVTVIAAVVFTYRSIAQNLYFSRAPQTKIMIVSLLTGITAFLIHNLIDFDIYNYELALMFLFITAILFSQVKIGLLQLKKVKLTYLLGVNPSKRRSLIFYILSALLVLSAVTAGTHIITRTALISLTIAGFALWSVSKEDIRRTAFDIPAAIFLTWLLLTLLYTPDLYNGISNYAIILSAVVIFYLFSQFLRRHYYKIAFSNIIIMTGTALALTAAIQFISFIFSGQVVHAAAFFPNNGLFAGYMLIPFSFILSRFLLEKKIRLFRTKIFLLFFFTAAAGISASKTGIISFLFVFISVWIYYSRNKGRVKDTPYRTQIKLRVLKCLLAAILIALFAGIGISENITAPKYQESPGLNRKGLYPAALSMIKDSPVFGYGIGGFSRAFPPYNFPAEGISKYMHTPYYVYNEFLQAAVISGLPGLIIFIFIIISIMKNPPSYTGHRKLWTAETGAYFAVAGILFHSFFNYTLHAPGILFTASIAAAMAVKEKYSISTVPRKTLFFTRIYYFPALILAFILFSAAIRPAMAQYMYLKYNLGGGFNYLEKARLADPLNTKYDFEKGLFFENAGMKKEALNSYRDILKFDRLNYTAMLHAARCSASLSEIESAAHYYNSAVAANPYRAFTYAEAADFYSALGDDRAAESYLKKAVDIEPNFSEAGRKLGEHYLNKGLYKKALEQFTNAEESSLELIPKFSSDKDILNARIGLLYASKALSLEKLRRYPESCLYYKKAYSVSRNPEILKKTGELCAVGEQNE